MNFFQPISLLALVVVLVGPTLALPKPEVYAHIPCFSVLDYTDYPRIAFHFALSILKFPARL